MESGVFVEKLINVVMFWAVAVIILRQILENYEIHVYKLEPNIVNFVNGFHETIKNHLKVKS